MSRKLMNLCLTALLSVVSTVAWALSEVGGVYQIGTAEDLKAFAELVNGDNPYANAVLTADIDKGTDITQIGRDGQDFQGVFDGAGHTITYDMTFTANGAGLFRNVGVHAIIQNLKVQGTIRSNSSFAGGIAGWNSGRIRGCYVDVNIISTKSGDATDGGMIGIAYRGTVVENCLVKVDIDGESTTNCGGVAGWANDKINVANCLVVSDGSTFNYADASNGHSSNIVRNEGNLQVVNLETYNADPYTNRAAGANYNNYVTQQWGTCNATTVVPLAELADGKICYQLNNDQSKINWVQNIGTDPFPVPAAFGSGQVYASGTTGCNGKAEGLTYSNEGTAQATPHTFDKYGICTTCGCFNFDCFEYDMTDASILLKSADDIYLAEGWNRVGDGFKLNMKMANDIDITAPAGQLIFNNGNWVDGNFDGDGHTLTIGMSDITVNEAAFIPIYTGNFKNVIMHGSIDTSGQFAGSITGRARGDGQKFSNVYSDITIYANRDGDNTTGGLMGIGHNTTNVENCIYAGNVFGGQCVAGFCGWAEGKTNFTNCAFLGELSGVGDSHTISRNNGNANCVNVYALNVHNDTDLDKFTATTAEAVASGELAFLLNGSVGGVERFYQVIGTDPEPMPIAKDGGLVYAVAAEYRCDGQPIGDEVTYSNTESGVIPDHQFVDGICTVCGAFDKDEDGYIKIINANTLIRFANLVNEGQTELKARMYADIDMKEQTFTPIGNQATLFVGEFDGQGHVISNLTVSGGDYTGLFGVVSGGADIRNFVLDKTCSISGGAFVGVIGGTNGTGNVYVTNVGNEGNVTGTAQNAAGILGVDMNGSATLFITNCYVTGSVKGARESATICGWSNGGSVVKNCYSIASLEGIYGDGSFTRGGTSIVNCYEIESVGQQGNVNKVTAEEVANGALCFKLGEPFGQLIGTDAYPIFNGPKVSGIADIFVNLGDINIEEATGGAECILPAKKYGGDYSAYTWLANADFDFGDWNTGNPNYNVIIGTPAEQDGKAWFAPGFSVDGWNYGQDLPGFGDGRPADVYAVRFFTVNGEIPSTLYMPAPHDDAPCEYYINGELIWSETDGWYEDEVVRLTDEQKALIKTDGKTINVFAFHVHQNWGGRYADGGLYTAGAPVDAFNNDGNKKAIDATIAIMEAQGIGAEAIEYASNINYRNGFAKGLAQLRKARRLAFDARTENFVGTEPADGMIAYIYNVGAKMFLAGGNNWGTHASLNHMGAKCVLHANSSGENRYTIQTNLPNGTRGRNDGLGHNGYVDCGDWNTTDAGWAWEFEALADGTYHIINCENAGDNIYLGMTDDDRLQVDTDKAGADSDFNKWLLVTPEEFAALAEQATAENPIDLGHLVHQATFSQNDFEGDDKWAPNNELGENRPEKEDVQEIAWRDFSKWDRNAGWIWGWKGNDAGGDYVFEMWNTKAKGKVYLVQEVEGLPAGKYTVQMNGYYRDGNFESADEGNVRQLAYMFAGSEENCVAIASIVDGSGNYPGLGRGGASGIVIPDGCRDAAKFFQVGTYVNTIDAEVGADGKLKIGLFRDAADDVKDGDWIVSDNWRLYYQGNPVEVEITEAGWATFVAPGNVNIIPEEVEVFAAQKVEGKDFVHLEPVAAIPAGEAVVLKGAEGTYTFYANAASAELGTTNDLIATTEEVTADGTQYVLGLPNNAEEGDDYGFWKATIGTTIPVGKGYLVFTGSDAKPFYPFGDDDATGIANIENALENGLIYNVAGQRIGKMQKGINIVNGKKVLR